MNFRVGSSCFRSILLIPTKRELSCSWSVTRCRSSDGAPEIIVYGVYAKFSVGVLALEVGRALLRLGVIGQRIDPLEPSHQQNVADDLECVPVFVLVVHIHVSSSGSKVCSTSADMAGFGWLSQSAMPRACDGP